MKYIMVHFHKINIPMYTTHSLTSITLSPQEAAVYHFLVTTTVFYIKDNQHPDSNQQRFIFYVFTLCTN